MSAAQPIECELHRVYLTKGGAFRLEMRFDDESYLTVDFEPESEGAQQITDTLTRVLTRTLSRLGDRGVSIVGMTAVTVEEPDEDADE